MAKAIFATYQFMMKFLTAAGIEEVRGNQLITRECYLIEIKGKQKAKEMFKLSSNNLAEQKQSKVEPAERETKVKVNEQRKTAKIWTQMLEQV